MAPARSNVAADGSSRTTNRSALRTTNRASARATRPSIRSAPTPTKATGRRHARASATSSAVRTAGAVARNRACAIEGVAAGDHDDVAVPDGIDQRPWRVDQGREPRAARRANVAPSWRP